MLVVIRTAETIQVASKVVSGHAFAPIRSRPTNSGPHAIADAVAGRIGVFRSVPKVT
ncbi:MAG: hypothetical protein WD981_05915 [Gaiellaceae bacterium]